MHSFKFEKAGWNFAQQIHPVVATSEIELKACAAAFYFNLLRVDCMLQLLPYLVDTTMNNVLLTATAFQRVLGTTDIEDPRRYEEEFRDSLEEEFRKEATAHQVRTFHDDTLGRGILRLRHTLSNSPQSFIKVGFQTLFASEILNAWTALETLLLELWEVSLNSGNEDWVKSIMQNPDVREGKQDKSVNFTDLYRHGFDLRHRMGSILKNKVKLATLDEMIAAFVPIVGKEQEQKWSIGPVADQLRALEATRHVLAHQAGKVDSKFIGKVKDLNIFGELTLGKELELDGEIAGILSEAAVHFGREILTSVNDQFKTWKEKKLKEEQAGN